MDLALLPVDGISLVAGGLSQALSVAASAETGGILLPPPVAYMHKIAVGPQARGAVDVSDTPENNLRRVAFAMNVQVQDLDGRCCSTGPATRRCSSACARSAFGSRSSATVTSASR